MFITPFAPEATPQPTQTSASDLLQRKDTTAWEDLSTCGWYSGTSSRPYVCVSPLTCSTDTGSVVGCVSEGMAQLYTSCLGYRDVRLGRCSSAGPKTGCCEDEALPDCGTFIWTGSPTRYMFKCFTETTTISMLDEPQFVVDAAKASAPEAFARSTSSPSLGLTVIPVPHTSTSSGATGTDTQESSTSSSLVLTVIPVPHRSSSKTTSTGPESPSPTILASSLISTTPISSSSAPADSPSTAITFPASNTGAPPGLSTATKAGIGAGVGVGVMVILLLAIFSPSFLKKSRKRKQAQGENSIAPALQQQEGGAPSEACHGKAELEDPRYLLGQLHVARGQASGTVEEVLLLSMVALGRLKRWNLTGLLLSGSRERWDWVGTVGCLGLEDWGLSFIDDALVPGSTVNQADPWTISTLDMSDYLMAGTVAHGSTI
ncbi:hypothetical protein VM1G_06660 [Cytospora mali]|uniref:Uncharacterized protein n=1 Tax=Cytospora mali TaxID=578113 RepID=A0A194W3U3_CYTMA|nr:hypothetical protein VM1G_06660 [Valsa mali]